LEYCPDVCLIRWGQGGDRSGAEGLPFRSEVSEQLFDCGVVSSVELVEAVEVLIPSLEQNSQCFPEGKTGLSFHRERDEIRGGAVEEVAWLVRFKRRTRGGKIR
jgi:hypothetical protein